MRGFSEALRRELEGSGVNVTYIAPRAIKTPLNSPAVYRMAEKVKMNMDEPADIARAIIRAIEQDKKDSYLGFPESLFVRINAVLPRLVDGSLRKQNQIMREYTHEH
jgi:short-subunit dehydrogenase